MGLFSGKSKQDEIERLVQENDELKNKLHKVLQKFESFEDLEEKLEKAKYELSTIEEKKEEVSEEIELLNGQIPGKQLEIDNLETSIEKLKSEEEAQKALADDARDKTEKLTGQKKELQRITAELDQRVSDTVQELEKLKSENESLTLRNDELEKRFTEIESKIFDLQKEEIEISEKIKSKEKFINEFEEKNTELQAMMQNLQSSREELQKDVADLQGLKQNLKKEIDELNSEKSENKSQLENFRKKIAIHEEIKIDLDKSISAITTQLSEKDTTLARFRDQKDTLKSEVLKLQAELTTLEEQIKYKNSELGNLDSKIKESSQHHDSLRNELKNFEDLKNDVHAAILGKKNTEEKLNEDILELKDEIKLLEAQKYNLSESQLKLENELSNTLQKFYSELTLAKEELNKIKMNILDREKDLKEKEDAFHEKSKMIAEYSGLVKVLQKEKSSIDENIDNLKKEQDRLIEIIGSYKKRENDSKIYLHELQSDADFILSKKNEYEIEFKKILEQMNRNFGELEEKKFAVQLELKTEQEKLDTIKTEVAESTERIFRLRDERSQIELEKEQFTAKVSELISMEKSLKSKITRYQNEISEIKSDNKNDINGGKDDENPADSDHNNS